MNMTKPFPFAPTPVIQRYLQTLVDFIAESEKYRQIENGKLINPIILESIKEDEILFSDFEDNRLSFVEYLTSENAVEVWEYMTENCHEIPYGRDSEFNEWGDIPPTAEEEREQIRKFGFKTVFQPTAWHIDYPKVFALRVLDVPKIITIYKEVVSETQIPDITSIVWDSKTGKLVFKNRVHTFQLRKGKNPILILFDILWNNRKETGKKTRIGKPMSRSDIAFEIVKRKKADIKQTTKELPLKIKSINKILRDEGIQIAIKGGEEDTQMVVTL